MADITVTCTNDKNVSIAFRWDWDNNLFHLLGLDGIYGYDCKIYWCVFFYAKNQYRKNNGGNVTVFFGKVKEPKHKRRKKRVFVKSPQSVARKRGIYRITSAEKNRCNV